MKFRAGRRLRRFRSGLGIGFVADQHQADATVAVEGLAHHLDTVSLGNHHRCEDPGKYGSIRQRQNREFGWENRIGGDDLPMLHAI